MKRLKTVKPWRKRMMSSDSVGYVTSSNGKVPDTFPKGKKMTPPKVKLSDYPYRITTRVGGFTRSKTARVAPLTWLFDRVGPHAYTDKNPRFFRDVPNVKITDGDSDWHVKVTPAYKRRKTSNNMIVSGSSTVTARWYFKNERQLALFLLSTNIRIHKK